MLCIPLDEVTSYHAEMTDDCDTESSCVKIYDHPTCTTAVRGAHRQYRSDLQDSRSRVLSLLSKRKHTSLIIG